MQSACFCYSPWNRFVFFCDARTHFQRVKQKTTPYISKTSFLVWVSFENFLKRSQCFDCNVAAYVRWVWLSLDLPRPCCLLCLECGISVCLGRGGLAHFHFVKSHYSNENANERKAVGNGSTWVACQKCFTGEGVLPRGGWAKLPPLPSERRAFSGGLELGGTWPSLKETHLHWCAYCYWFLFMVFKQLMQVLTAFPFSYLHKPFYFGKISEGQRWE